MNQGLHHISTRKRIYQNLEKYPHPERGKKFFDEFMYVIAIIGPFMILPQVMEILVNKNVQGISVATWFLFGVTAIFWFVYGILHKERPIALASFLSIIFNFLVVIGVLINR